MNKNPIKVLKEYLQTYYKNAVKESLWRIVDSFVELLIHFIKFLLSIFEAIYYIFLLIPLNIIILPFLWWKNKK